MPNKRKKGKRRNFPLKWSTQAFEKAGWTVTVVERWIPSKPFPVTKDAFGFGDLLVCHERYGIGLCQTSSQDHFADRRAKITEAFLPDGSANPVFMKYIAWKAAGGRVFLHGWKRSTSLKQEEL